MLKRFFLEGGFLAGAASLLWAACLPDPPIAVPDFAPAVQSDGGMTPKMDAPSGDLGAARWNIYGTVTGAPTLRAAWVADPGLSEVFAVGQHGLILHRVGDGPWQPETSGTDANLYAISASTKAEVYAVGDRGVILRRSAGTWREEGKELRLNSTLYAVTVLASGEVVAAGDLGVVVRRQPGGVWVAETGEALPGLALRAVFGAKLEGMYAVGLGSAIVRRLQGTWQRDKLAIDPGGSGNYYAVTGTADGAEVYIAGEYGVLLHRAPDGTRWLLDKLRPQAGMPTPLHLFSLFLQDGELLVSGAGGVVARRSGGALTIEQTGTTNDLYGLSGAGLRSVLSVGAHGAALRRL